MSKASKKFKIKHGLIVSESVLYTAVDRVGINTTSPQVVGLNIDGAISSSEGFYIPPKKYIRFGQLSSQPNQEIAFRAVDGAFEFNSGSNTTTGDILLTISKSGYDGSGKDARIGIGKTNPATNLDVEGNISASGHYGIAPSKKIIFNPSNLANGTGNNYIGESAGNMFYNSVGDIRIRPAGQIKFESENDLRLTLSGSNLNMEGSISASNDISASGNIIAKSLILGGSGGAEGSLNITGDLSASAITASGTLYANEGVFNTLTIPSVNLNVNTLSSSGYVSASLIDVDGNIIGRSGLQLDGLSTQGSEKTALLINGSNIVGTRELGDNAFNSTTIGTTTNSLTAGTGVDLNSGTTFDGSAAKTINLDITEIIGAGGTLKRGILTDNEDGVLVRNTTTLDNNALIVTSIPISSSGNIIFDGDRDIKTAGEDSLTIIPGANLNLGTSQTDHIYMGRQSGWSSGTVTIYGNSSTPALQTKGGKVAVGGTQTTDAALTVTKIAGESVAISASGDVHVEGIVMATQYQNTYNSSSILYSSGDTTFGDSTDDIHSFTGSLNVSGSGKIAEFGTTALEDQYIQIRKSNQGSLMIGIDKSLNDNKGGGLIQAGLNKPLYFAHGNSTFGGVTPSLVLSGSKIGLGDVDLTGPYDIHLGGDVSASGNISAEHLTSMDDAYIADIIRVGGKIKVGDDITSPTFTEMSNASLTVVGDVSSSGNIYVGHRSNAKSKIIFGSGINDNVEIYSEIDGTASSLNLIVDDDGSDSINIKTKGYSQDRVDARGTVNLQGGILNTIVSSGSNDSLLRYHIQSEHSASDGSGRTFHSRLSMVNDGRIGIGTAVPASLLTINGTGGNTSGLMFENAYDDVKMYFTDNNNDSNFLISYVGTGGAELELQADGDLILDGTNGGNVGIGTTSPGYKLTVNSGTTNEIARFASSDNDALISVGDNVDTTYWGIDGSAKHMSLGFDNAMGSTNLNISSSGEVGIGINPHPETELSVMSNHTLTDFIGDNKQGIRLIGKSDNNNITQIGFSGRDYHTYPRNLAGIGAHYSNYGTKLLFGTTDDFNTGIKYIGMVVDEKGNVGINHTKGKTDSSYWNDGTDLATGLTVGGNISASGDINLWGTPQGDGTAFKSQILAKSSMSIDIDTTAQKGSIDIGTNTLGNKYLNIGRYTEANTNQVIRIGSSQLTNLYHSKGKIGIGYVPTTDTFFDVGLKGSNMVIQTQDSKHPRLWFWSSAVQEDGTTNGGGSGSVGLNQGSYDMEIQAGNGKDINMIVNSNFPQAATGPNSTQTGDTALSVLSDGSVQTGLGSHTTIKGQLGIHFSSILDDVYSNSFWGTNHRASSLFINNSNSLQGAYSAVDFRVNNADGRIAFVRDVSETGRFEFITDAGGGNTRPRSLFMIQDAGFDVNGINTLYNEVKVPSGSLIVGNNSEANDGHGLIISGSGGIKFAEDIGAAQGDMKGNRVIDFGNKTKIQTQLEQLDITIGNEEVIGGNVEANPPSANANYIFIQPSRYGDGEIYLGGSNGSPKHRVVINPPDSHHSSNDGNRYHDGFALNVYGGGGNFREGLTNTGSFNQHKGNITLAQGDIVLLPTASGDTSYTKIHTKNNSGFGKGIWILGSDGVTEEAGDDFKGGEIKIQTGQGVGDYDNILSNLYLSSSRVDIGHTDDNKHTITGSINVSRGITSSFASIGGNTNISGKLYVADHSTFASQEWGKNYGIISASSDASSNYSATIFGTGNNGSAQRVWEISNNGATAGRLILRSTSTPKVDLGSGRSNFIDPGSFPVILGGTTGNNNHSKVQAIGDLITTGDFYSIGSGSFGGNITGSKDLNIGGAITASYVSSSGIVRGSIIKATDNIHIKSPSAATLTIEGNNNGWGTSLQQDTDGCFTIENFTGVDSNYLNSDIAFATNNNFSMRGFDQSGSLVVGSDTIQNHGTAQDKDVTDKRGHRLQVFGGLWANSNISSSTVSASRLVRSDKQVIVGGYGFPENGQAADREYGNKISSSLQVRSGFLSGDVSSSYNNYGMVIHNQSSNEGTFAGIGFLTNTNQPDINPNMVSNYIRSVRTSQGSVTQTEASLRFGTGEGAFANYKVNDRLAITPKGWVGIGTNTPDQFLHIVSESNPQLLIEESSTRFVRLGVEATDDDMCLGWDDQDDMHFGVFGSRTDATINTHMIIKGATGKVGVNTIDPMADFHTVGTISGSDINSAGDVVAYYSSDENLKYNIKTIENPIDKVQQLRGVRYNWGSNQTTYPEGTSDSGIIAQDVQKVLPELVRTNHNGYLGVRHDRLVGLLIESVKEQQKQIDELKDEVEKLKGDS